MIIRSLFLFVKSSVPPVCKVPSLRQCLFICKSWSTIYILIIVVLIVEGCSGTLNQYYKWSVVCFLYGRNTNFSVFIITFYFVQWSTILFVAYFAGRARALVPMAWSMLLVFRSMPVFDYLFVLNKSSQYKSQPTMRLVIASTIVEY